MYYNPFDVKNMEDEKIIEIIKKNVSSCSDTAETVSSLTKNVMYLTDTLLLYGELCSRMQERYAYIKLQNGIKEEELIADLRKNSTEKQTAGYYKAQAQKQMTLDYKNEMSAQADVSRMKLAFEATQEKINAVKKKIDAIKFEFAAQ